MSVVMNRRVTKLNTDVYARTCGAVEPSRQKLPTGHGNCDRNARSASTTHHINTSKPSSVYQDNTSPRDRRRSYRHRHIIDRQSANKCVSDMISQTGQPVLHQRRRLDQQPAVESGSNCSVPAMHTVRSCCPSNRRCAGSGNT